MVKYDDILIVIPARGGSKGVPRKNLRKLWGLPLVVHSILHAKDTHIPNDNILVSSDDTDILKIAEEYQVVPHVRPTEICQDDSSTESALIDAYRARPKCSTIVTLQPTSPIRYNLSECIQFYFDHGFDSLLTTTKFYDFMWRKTKDGWQPTYDPQNRPMRQSMDDSEILHFDNGNTYISDVQMLLETKCRLGGEIGVYDITQIEGIQIDDLKDFDMLERGRNETCESNSRDRLSSFRRHGKSKEPCEARVPGRR